jgi:hypothetical protein
MVSMRVLAMLGVGLLATAGGAQASSIVVLGVSTSTPSVIRLGAPESSTPSVVAFGEPAPDVTDEKVAAIPEKSEHHGFMPSPMIIRGGVVGGAFATPAATPAKATAAAAPAAAADTKSPADGKPAGTATASNGAAEPKSQAEPQPQPAAAPPSPPVGKAM